MDFQNLKFSEKFICTFELNRSSRFAFIGYKQTHFLFYNEFCGIVSIHNSKENGDRLICEEPLFINVCIWYTHRHRSHRSRSRCLDCCDNLHYFSRLGWLLRVATRAGLYLTYFQINRYLHFRTKVNLVLLFSFKAGATGQRCMLQ